MTLSHLTSGVLVSGVGAPPGLGMLRSLREADPDLRLAAADLNPLSGGLFEPGVIACPLPSAADPHAYRAALMETCRTHKLDIVIPGSEAEVAALAPARDEFAGAGIRLPVPEPEVVEYGIDKGKLLALAAERGLPHPLTLQPQSEADVSRWSGDFPCVIKPRRSRGARGVSYPASFGDLHRIWRETVADHGDCVIQDFIPGGPDTIYTVGTLWNEGRLVTATLHRKLQTNPPSGGVAVAGETLVDQELVDAGITVLEASGPWHGLAAVELKRPAPGEPPYLLEINPRMWGFGYLMTLAGLNIPALLVRVLAGDPGLDPAQFRVHPAYRPARMTRTWMDVRIPLETESVS